MMVKATILAAFTTQEQVYLSWPVFLHCEHFIKYECYGSMLFCSFNGWWVSRDSSKTLYWGGASPGSNKCACRMTNQWSVQLWQEWRCVARRQRSSNEKVNASGERTQVWTYWSIRRCWWEVLPRTGKIEVLWYSLRVVQNNTKFDLTPPKIVAWNFIFDNVR